MNTSNIQKEIWKDIPNHEKSHQISNLGRVRSIDRVIVDSLGRIFNMNGKILKLNTNEFGYKIISIGNKGVHKNFKVHQLVAIVFLNHDVSNKGFVVDHINHIKTDNRVENLQIISHRENSSKDKFRYNKSSMYVGVHLNRKSKRWVSTIQINGIRNYLGTFIDEYVAHLAYQKKLSQLTV